MSQVRALLHGKFQWSTAIEDSALSYVLDELDWNSQDRLVVFDDIVFAPLAARYGSNAILSPHDCMSGMFRSHFRSSFPKSEALKYWLQSTIAHSYERQCYHLALLTHLVTERDRIWVQQVNSLARYHVAPYADLSNFSLQQGDSDVWDVLVWADLRIASAASGVKRFFQTIMSDPAPWREVKIALVGRISLAQAEKILGNDLLSLVEYSQYLEGEDGVVRWAKVTLVPDLGGAGIKSRCLSVLASGVCLACLYSQMEGITGISDRGAINAATMGELARKIRDALGSGHYADLAAAGTAMYQREFSESRIRQMWIEMVKRAVTVRASYDAVDLPSPAGGASACA